MMAGSRLSKAGSLGCSLESTTLGSRLSGTGSLVAFKEKTGFMAGVGGTSSSEEQSATSTGTCVETKTELLILTTSSEFLHVLTMRLVFLENIVVCVMGTTSEIGLESADEVK